MPMTNCFIGYRLKQRLNEMEKKIDGGIKKRLTIQNNATTSVCIGGDVAGVQPTVKDDQGDLK